MSEKVVQTAFGGPEVLHVVDVPDPDPGALGPGEVLVRVGAAGVNPVDAKTRRGTGMPMGGFPFTVGWDLAGTVVAAGATGPFRPGERVFGMAAFPRPVGAYAQYAVAPAADLVRVPASIDDVHAAALPLAALTAWQLLVDVAALEPGQRILIQGGGGGVGHLAVQLARHLGAHVITTASAPKRDWLLGLGADEVIDHTRTDVVAAMRNSPVDVVLDTVSGPLAGPSLSLVKPGGVLIELPGVADDVAAAAGKAGVRAIYQAVHTDQDQLRHLAALAEEGALTATVSETYPLDRAADAHRQIESGRTRGKIVLIPW